MAFLLQSVVVVVWQLAQDVPALLAADWGAGRGRGRATNVRCVFRTTDLKKKRKKEIIIEIKTSKWPT